MSTVVQLLQDHLNTNFLYMKRIICFLLSTIGLVAVQAQLYTPIDTANLTVRTAEAKEYLKNTKLYYDFARDSYKSGESKLFKNRFININKVLNEDILSGQYIFDTRFQKLMESVVHEIITVNPTLPTDFRFYVSRNNSLNAASLGNKYFTMNLGTFYLSQNDDQLGAIICHEIAHYQLNHVLQDIQYKYGLKKAEDLKNEIYEIKNDNTNRGDKAYNKLKDLLYQEGHMNKKQEYEADSLGYYLYRNTHFSKADYLNSFRLKETYDTIRPIGLEVATYKKVFNLPNQPFKEEWMKKEDFSKYDYSKYKDKYNQDSLSSHPETEKRIKALIKSFPELAKLEDPREPSASFTKLSDIAGLEQPCTFEIQEEYGVGIYFCLHRIQDNDQADYYRNYLGIFFQKIYDARKHYTLNRYLDKLIPKEQSESYQQFLSFMWNLNLAEIKTIADYYSKKSS